MAWQWLVKATTDRPSLAKKKIILILRLTDFFVVVAELGGSLSSPGIPGRQGHRAACFLCSGAADAPCTGP